MRGYIKRNLKENLESVSNAYQSYGRERFFYSLLNRECEATLILYFKACTIILEHTFSYYNKKQLDRLLSLFIVVLFYQRYERFYASSFLEQ